MAKYLTFSFPTLIHFGPGVRSELGDFLKTQGVRRPLVVTDKGVGALPFFKEILKQLSQKSLEPGSFTEIFGNPVKSQVIAGVEVYRKHKADSVVAVGGGAAIDVAKAIVLLASHTGDLFDYEDGKPGARPIDGTIPYWVALPTTSGTGSEVGRSTVISEDQTHVKKVIFSAKLLARAVFADPELTLELPAKVTAATGMDALTHCVESYLAKDYHPICDGIALEGLGIVAENLVKCVKTPSDIAARSQMMMASMMGAIAFQKGLGLTHSCAHALSTVADLHHGLANGVMIDYALEFNIEAVPERFQRMARRIGLEQENAAGFIRWLTELKKEIGIPARLSELGIEKQQLSKLTEFAFRDGCHQSNPRVCAQDDFLKIYTKAL